jgi:hypothetical protein
MRKVPAANIRGSPRKTLVDGLKSAVVPVGADNGNKGSPYHRLE